MDAVTIKCEFVSSNDFCLGPYRKPSTDFCPGQADLACDNQLLEKNVTADLDPIARESVCIRLDSGFAGSELTADLGAEEADLACDGHPTEKDTFSDLYTVAIERDAVHLGGDGSSTGIEPAEDLGTEKAEFAFNTHPVEKDAAANMGVIEA